MPRKPTKAQIERDQKVAAEILTSFMFVRTMEDVQRIWKETYDAFDLYDDPFTGCPVSPSEYADNNIKYQRQSMIEKYGHCDGLE